MTDGENKSLVRMFKALSHPNRFRLFTEIVRQTEAAFEGREVCFLNRIMESLNVGAPTVSHHLKELVQADLVTTEREGKFLTCRPNLESVEKLRAFFAQG